MLELVTEEYNCSLTIQCKGNHVIKIDKMTSVARVMGLTAGFMELD
jgi:hypothetical protein